MIEQLLNSDQLKKLVEAINNNQEYNYSENGLSVNAKSTDNGLSIQVSYNMPNRELDEFNNFLSELDDDLFTEVCEVLGNEKVVLIDKYLKSEDLEKIRTAIVLFKSTLRTIARNKIKHLEKYV